LKLSILSLFALAIVIGVLTVFVIDPLDKSTISTPFLLGIALMGFALRQKPFLITIVSIVYFFFTLYALVRFHQYYAVHVYKDPHPYFWLFQRSGLFVILGMLSIYLAYYRTGTERVIERFQTILSKLPSPVIMSDASGKIVYANDAVVPLFHQTPSEIVGSSYFELVLTESMKGKSIRAYFEMFENDKPRIRPLEIRPFGPAHKWQAHIVCIGAGSNRVMITVLQNPEQEPRATRPSRHDTRSLNPI
jgi:PAS domain-containing protein